MVTLRKGDFTITYVPEGDGIYWQVCDKYTPCASGFMSAESADTHKAGRVIAGFRVVTGVQTFMR